MPAPAFLIALIKTRKWHLNESRIYYIMQANVFYVKLSAKALAVSEKTVRKLIQETDEDHILGK